MTAPMGAVFVPQKVRCPSSSGLPSVRSVGAKPVQRLFQSYVPIEIVAPMLARAPLSLALDHPLQAQDDAASLGGTGLQGFGQVEMTGDLKSRRLPGFRCHYLPGFQEVRNLSLKSVRHGSIPVVVPDVDYESRPRGVEKIGRFFF